MSAQAISAIRFGVYIILLAVLLSGVQLQEAHAETVVIAGWDVAGIKLDDGTNVPPYRINAHTSAVQLVTAELTLSTNVNSSTATSSYGFRISATDQTTSLGEAIQSGHFFEIALQVSAGYRLHLDSLDIVGQASATGCDDIAVLSDVEGFSTNGIIASVNGIAGVTGGFDARSSSTNGFGGPINLSHLRFSELKSIRIRFYGWNSSGTTGATWIRNLTSLGGYDLNVFGTIEKLPGGTVWVVQ